MDKFWTISGWFLTVVFGALSVWQFWKEMKEAAAWSERKKSLATVKLNLVQLRTALTEAGETKRIIDTDAGLQFLNLLGHQVKGIEHHIDLMLTDKITDKTGC